MTQQISIEDAFPVYRQRCGELFDENLLLRSQVASLEREGNTLREENERLRKGAPSGGPDPTPPYAPDEQG